ncbi:hypothetical protein [Nesterenkonia flava]|uniref:Uncharacterized protein n=1 Tax=Nesterenkonia flava TaxID=469799 RepID=A0ABU1FW87_9MICC|nr:hypothetical protein [Nesterenkonia flava]MDR5712592.1 hypothetical protein [Nesterenkonia flava]
MRFAKAGVNALSGSIRSQLFLEKLDDVHVVTVLPPTVDTPLFHEVANYTGRRVVPMPPVYSPQRVADTILMGAKKPRHEMPVGQVARQMIIQHRASPDTAEKMMAKQVDKKHLSRKEPSRANTGNLYESAPEETAEVEGGWGGRNRQPDAGRKGPQEGLRQGAGPLMGLLSTGKKQAQRLKGAQMVTDFECSINAVRAAASFLRGDDHGAMSTGPSSRVLAKLATLPPARARAEAFLGAAMMQGLALEQAREIDVDLIDTWVTEQYGPGPFPAVLIGTPNGAAYHLSAALGVPFLPQTPLVSVKDSGTHVDDPVEAMEALAPTAQLIAQNNPRVKVYHMHDPAQDRPMMQQLAFMRLKRLSLGPVYEQFLRERLAPGGTVIQLENTRDWRTTSTGERTLFQFGCLGGVPEEEFHASGERIAKFLEQKGPPTAAGIRRVLMAAAPTASGAGSRRSKSASLR